MFRYSERAGQGLQNQRKTALWLLGLIFIISLSFVGCGNPPVDNVPYEPVIPETISTNGKPVTAPVEILYIVKNPLEIIEEEITEGTNEEEGIQLRHEIISVSGLKDKEVEKKINDRIRDTFEKLKSSNLPPYRGIKKAIPENALLVEDYIYIDETANFNNVLSLWLNRSTTYALPGEQGDYLRDASGFYHNTKYVSVQEGLNFDLNTGNEITLADVFADNVDYLAMLNDAVSRELNESSAQDEGYFIRWYGMKLTESFKGLSPEQKFYISSYGISLIFDYNTPEFYMPEFMAQTTELYYGDLEKTIAITERFYDDGESIFLSEKAPAKELIGSGFSSTPIKKEEYRDGSVDVYNYARSSPQFPGELMEKIMELSNRPQKEIEELNRIISLEGVNWSGEKNGYLEQNVSATTVGPYGTITRSKNGGAGEYWFFSLEYHTYDLETGKKLVLADLFIPGFDYLTPVRSSLKKAISENGGLYRDGNRLSPLESEQELNEMIENSLEFHPNTDSIWIVAGDVEFAGPRREPLNISVTFEEVGYDNMMVFKGR